MAGNIAFSDHKIFNQMLIADQFRGVDSTGVCVVRGGKASTYKRAVISSEYVEDRAYDSLMVNGASYIMGHNRAATAGSVIDANSHPFTHDHITLMHNGTLTGYDITGADKFSVDSEAVCYAIAKDGWRAVVEKITGAFVLIWFDARDGSLHFAGNGQRKFSAAIANGKLYWASEKKMLDWILDRNKVKVAEWFELGIGRHVSLIHKSGTRIDSKSFKVEEFTLAKEPVTAWHYGSYYGSAVSHHTPRTYNSGLRDLGLSIGQSIKVRFNSFTPYQSQSDKGLLCGHTVPDLVTVKVHRAEKPELGFEYWGTVSGTNPAGTEILLSSYVPASSGRYKIAGQPVSGAAFKQALDDEKCMWCTDGFTADELAEAVEEHSFDGLFHKECSEQFRKAMA